MRNFDKITIEIAIVSERGNGLKEREVHEVRSLKLGPRATCSGLVLGETSLFGSLLVLAVPHGLKETFARLSTCAACLRPCLGAVGIPRASLASAPYAFQGSLLLSPSWN